MLRAGDWEYAVISSQEGRRAQVTWNPTRRLPTDLHQIALELGYTAGELSTCPIGELGADLVTDEDTFLRGAIVLPDEHGIAAVLFGQPLLVRRR